MPTSPAPRGTRSARARMRPFALLGVPAITLGVTILLVAPVASASYAVEDSPPFVGVAPNVGSSLNTVGCQARGGFGIPAEVNATTGLVRVRVHASVTFCAGTGDFDYADAGAVTGFVGPDFTVPVAGTYYATYEWVFSYAASVSATGPANNTTALVSIFELGYLNDLTNGTVLTGTGGDVFALFHELHTGSWSGTGHREVVPVVNTFSLVAGHLYQFETVTLDVVDVWARGVGTATSALNLGSDGNHGRLVLLEIAS